MFGINLLEVAVVAVAVAMIFGRPLSAAVLP
jgi:hypothetical protein